MPLLRRDNGRGRGSPPDKWDSNANRRSLAEFLGLDTSGPSRAIAAPTQSRHPNNLVGEGSWNDCSSPEAARSPRASVPAGCFPPRDSPAFASYSESAQLRSGWQDEVDSAQMSALVGSLEYMKLSSQNTRSLYASVPQSIGLVHDQLEKADELHPWPPEQAGTSAPDNRSNYLARRASFGGATSAGRGRQDKNDLMWNGYLPLRCADPAGGFSAKVFLGGLPWDISEQVLMQSLKLFNPIRVEWPGRDSGGDSPRGYAYVTFENERRVRSLLAASRRDGCDWYYRITSRKMRNKEVQVIPWAVSDSNWMSGGSARLEPSRTVFVGALHGMITAAGLAIIMNDLFPGVVYAGIDTDKNKYPIGSGRVTFNNVHSYVRAISAAFIEIRTSKFTKRVQIDPYLEDSMCSICKLQQGPYFCREPTCFGYFCRSCWTWSHTSHTNENHKPLMRCSKSALSCGQYLPILPALSAPETAVPAIAAYDNGSAAVNGEYSRQNEETPSPGNSMNSAASALSGQQLSA